MKFADYHRSLPRGARRRLADALGIAPTYLASMARGRRPVSARLWTAIVRETDGAVSLESLATDAAEYRRGKAA